MLQENFQIVFLGGDGGGGVFFPPLSIFLLSFRSSQCFGGRWVYFREQSRESERAGSGEWDFRFQFALKTWKIKDKHATACN